MIKFLIGLALLCQAQEKLTKDPEVVPEKEGEEKKEEKKEVKKVDKKEETKSPERIKFEQEYAKDMYIQTKPIQIQDNKGMSLEYYIDQQGKAGLPFLNGRLMISGNAMKENYQVRLCMEIGKGDI